MPFVTRDKTGAITALRTERAEEAREYLPPEDPEIIRFSSQSRPAPRDAQVADVQLTKAELRESDLDMIRVYEDLLDLLIQKNLVMLTEFPAAAQEKLLRRKHMRSLLNPISDILVGEEDGLF